MDSQELVSYFGCQLIRFMGSKAGMADMAKANSPAYTLSLSMPWAERYFIMEAIDNLRPEAVREGGRTAYLALFGAGSWEEELKRVYAVLSAPGHCYTYSVS